MRLPFSLLGGVPLPGYCGNEPYWLVGADCCLRPGERGCGAAGGALRLRFDMRMQVCEAAHKKAARVSGFSLFVLDMERFWVFAFARHPGGRHIMAAGEIDEVFHRIGEHVVCAMD